MRRNDREITEFSEMRNGQSETVREIYVPQGLFRKVEDIGMEQCGKRRKKI